MDEKKLLGKQIKIARKQSGMTAEKLSELCDMDTTYLRQIECGSKMPSLSMFIILCRELRVSPSVLLSTILPEPEYAERDNLHELYRTLTPEQKDLLKTLLTNISSHLTP